MYLPQHFAETRIEVLQALMRRHPFATLVVATPEGLEASQLPFEIDPSPQPYGTLRCHVARANPLWGSFSRDVQALVIFQGPDSYISPSWYPAKQEHGKVVPTWNYVTVHAYGTPTVVEDSERLREFVEALTLRHESGRARPWQVSDAPADYLDKMLTAIVGIEIPIARLQGKWKLSQNRSRADREGVVEGLACESGASAQDTAELIRQTLSG